jgi:hypothetical protein
MLPDPMAAAILLALVVIGLLSAFGATAMTYGHDSRRDDPRAGLSPWR